MRNLAEDREEMSTDAERRWVARRRREYGIAPDEATCWFVDKEQNDDRAMVYLGRSPGDALAYAETYDANANRRNGIGLWTLEVEGDGVNTPLMLRVYPMWDEAYDDA